MNAIDLPVWLIAGGVAGFLANSVGRRNIRFITDIIIGSLGGLASGLFFSLVDTSAVAEVNLGSVCVSFIGAVLLLIVLHGNERNNRLAT